MKDFVFEMGEPSNYEERGNSSKRFNFLISFGIFALVSLGSGWKYGLAIAFVFWFVQYIKSSRWDKYFIVCIEKKDGQVKVRYKEENQQKEIIGSIEDFKIKKEIAFNRSRTVYLAFYYKESLLLKQFEIGDWNEKVFDEIILATT
jgi:hypothetical protein